MKIYDITPPLSEDMVTFPGDPPVQVDPLTRVDRGEMANVSRLTLSTHAGTHIDPPSHFDDRGTPADMVTLSLLMGEALVIEIPGTAPISAGVLKELPIMGQERLILKTGNSRLWESSTFQEEFSHLTIEAAGYLIKVGVKVVGIDYLSVERYDGDGSVHRLLLDGGIVIIEGLNLEGVPPGHYELICLPLRLKGGDGAPARAVLVSR